MYELLKFALWDKKLAGTFLEDELFVIKLFNWYFSAQEVEGKKFAFIVKHRKYENFFFLAKM